MQSHRQLAARFGGSGRRVVANARSGTAAAGHAWEQLPKSPGDKWPSVIEPSGVEHVYLGRTRRTSQRTSVDHKLWVQVSNIPSRGRYITAMWCEWLWTGLSATFAATPM
jgi:hypothetical protein